MGLKIGVARPNFDDLDDGFSDSVKGWSWHCGKGELLHNQYDKGKKYPSQVSDGDIIGVILDMVLG